MKHLAQQLKCCLHNQLALILKTTDGCMQHGMAQHSTAQQQGIAQQGKVMARLMRDSHC